MKHVDYIIVGMGIAGLVFSKTLRDKGKSFVVIDNPKQGATKVSGGVLNPTVLKRFTPAWNTVEFVLKAAPFMNLWQGILANRYSLGWPFTEF